MCRRHNLKYPQHEGVFGRDCALDVVEHSQDDFAIARSRARAFGVNTSLSPTVSFLECWCNRNWCVSIRAAHISIEPSHSTGGQHGEEGKESEEDGEEGSEEEEVKEEVSLAVRNSRRRVGDVA